VRSVGLLFAVEFVRAALLVSLLPFMVTHAFGLPLDVAAVAISAHYLLDTLGRSPSGLLVDRVGPRTVLFSGLVASLGLLLLLSFATTHTPLWLLLGLYGLAISPLWPVVIGRAAAGGDRRGEMMGGVFALWLVAIGLGPIAMNILLQMIGWQVAFGLLLAVQTVAVVLAAGVPLGGRTTGGGLPRELWRHVRRVAVLFPGMFVQTMTLGLLLPVINAFAGQYLGAVGFRYAELLALGGGTAVVLMVPLGRLADRLGARQPLAVGLLLAAVGLVALGLSRNFWAAVGLAGLIGGAYALILPAWNNFLASVVPRQVRGALWGLFMTVEGLGLTVGPVLGAKAWDLWRPTGPFFLAAGVLLAMGVFYLTAPLSRLTDGERPW
jgi:DHA1 family multidrug resistance protein-like MFS transporter